MEKATNILIIFSEWVMNLFLLHLYWLFGTAIGGIIFGIIPSSVALFSSIRQLFMHPKDTNVRQHFKLAYKTNFKNSQLLGLYYLAIVILMMSYYNFLIATTTSLWAYFHLFIYVFLVILILFSFYLIPVYLHFEMPIKSIVPNTFRILLFNMKWNIPMLFSVLAIILLYIKFSVSLVVFGIALPAFIISFYCRITFKNFEKALKNLH